MVMTCADWLLFVTTFSRAETDGYLICVTTDPSEFLHNPQFVLSVPPVGLNVHSFEVKAEASLTSHPIQGQFYYKPGSHFKISMPAAHHDSVCQLRHF